MVEDFELSEGERRSIEDLKLQLANRRVWMASSIHKGEEEGEILLLIFKMMSIRCHVYARLTIKMFVPCGSFSY